MSRAGIEPTTLRLYVRLRYHYAIETTPLATGPLSDWRSGIAVGHVTEGSWVRFPLETSVFPETFFRYYKPSFVFIYLLAYNVYPSLDPVYFFEAYIGASR